jgi:hypothetical protein
MSKDNDAIEAWAEVITNHHSRESAARLRMFIYFA